MSPRAVVAESQPDEGVNTVSWSPFILPPSSSHQEQIWR
jgi:hypothetical protein